MVLSARLILIPLSFLTVSATELPAQLTVSDPPKLFVPARPETQQEQNHREAVKLFGRAILNERANRFLEAVRNFEQAMQLDPDAAAPCKALIPLYLALDRIDDALAICQKAVDLDPADYETWILLARQHRAQDRPKEAAAALARAAACPKIKEHPEVQAQVAFDLGVLYENLHDFSGAERAFQDVVGVLDSLNRNFEIRDSRFEISDGDFNKEEIEAQVAETYERLGRLMVKAGNSARAAEYFAKARDKVKAKDPARAKRLAYNLAEVYMARGQWSEALTSLDEYLQTMPQGTEAYRAKIKVMEQLGRSSEILPMLQAYAQRDHHNTALKLLLAETYGNGQDFDKAESLFRELAKTSPGPEIYKGLFKLYASGMPPRYENLVGLLDETIGRAAPRKENQPGDPEAAARVRAMLTVLRADAGLVRAMMPVIQQRLTGGQPLHSHTCFFVGVLAARTHQLEAAEQLFRSCLRSPGRFRPNPQEADAFTNLVRVLRLAHKHEAILQVCREGLERPQAVLQFFLHLEAAQALSRLGQQDKALAEANAAVEKAPDPSRLFCRRIRVQILARAGHLPEALGECQEMLKEYTNPDQVRDIRHTLSMVYSEAHDHTRAEEQLRLLLQADPNDATANNDLGYIWADQGKHLEEAEKLIRKAIDLDRKQRTGPLALETDSDRDNAAYLDSLGWVLFRRGQIEAARRELEKAVALPEGTDDPVVWDHLADVYYRLGEGKLAVAAWRKAIHLYEYVRERPLDERHAEINRKLKLLESKVSRQ